MGVDFAREVPTAGAEGDNHVGNEAGEGGALFNAAEEGGSDGAMLGVDVDGQVSDAFGEKFNVTFGREAFEEEWEELKLEGDAVKEFFFVFVNLGKDGVAMLLDIFEGCNVAKGDVGAGVARAVGLYGVWEGVGILKEGGEVFAEMNVEKGIVVVKEGDRTSVGRAWFGDEGSAALLGTMGHEAGGKDEGGEALKVVAPFGGEAREDVKGVVFVAYLRGDAADDRA